MLNLTHYLSNITQDLCQTFIIAEVNQDSGIHPVSEGHGHEADAHSTSLASTELLHLNTLRCSLSKV